MQRRGSRLPAFAAGLFATLAASRVVVAAPATPEEVEQLYNEGSRSHADRNYAEAAVTWTQLLEVLPESPANLTLRESVVIAVLDAYESAFEVQLGPDGSRDIEHLLAAKRVADVYVAQFNAAYGTERARNPEVDRAIADIEGAIAEQMKLEEEPAVVGPCLSPPHCLSEIEPRPGCGDGRTAAPFVVLPLAIRRRRRREALDRLAARLPADVVARLHTRDVDDD